MKSTIFGFIILGVVMGIGYLSYKIQTRTTIETIDGHQYIRARGMYGDDIEHSENCWCKKK